MVILKNEFLKITVEEDGIYLETFKKGYSIQDFNKILIQNPDIKIVSFIVIRNALLNAPQAPAKFAESKNRIVLKITDNDMKAFITLNVDDSEYMENNRKRFIGEIASMLRESGIVFGVKTDVLLNQLCNGKPVLIAEGIPPVNGDDSIIRMYELKEPKPEIKEDGKADYYELNLINKVCEGEWLGERIDPTDGTPGKTIRGNAVKPLPGKQYPLFYDPETVREEYKDGITVLFSKINGAVHYKGDKISVSNYLEINQDVDFTIGNIDFDGFLTIKGAISNNFSVAAKNDIEILGEYGVGSVKEVVSRGGNILIKGGIAGKNKAVIKSTRDIYTKFISDATVICSGIVYAGYYCLNSNIIAKQLIIESNKGRIIGGTIRAEQKVEAAYIGNSSEKRTQIIVSGFDRNALKDELEKLQSSVQTTRNNLSRAKQHFAIFSYSIDAGSRQFKEYEEAKENYFKYKDEVKRLESEIRTIQKYFKVKGEGEVNILKRLYPNTSLIIGGTAMEIKKEKIAACFFLQEKEIREI